MKSSGIRLLVTENTDAMLAYWDTDEVCRYANSAYFKWFGMTPDMMIDKITLKELLRDIYPKNLPYIRKVLQGETQVFYRDIQIPTGEVKRSIATYHPDIQNGIVKGFFVHVADLGQKTERVPTASEIADTKELIASENSFDETKPDSKMAAIAGYLKTEMFNGFPGLGRISKAFLISVSKLKRDFKASYNSTPLVYYRNLQMEYAADYLKEKKVSKKELASLLNFSNPSNFSNYFKKFINDVGQQRQQAFIRKQSHELNKIFIEQSPFAIAMFDINMNYLAVSQQWIVDYNLEYNELIGRSHYNVFPRLPEAFKEIHRQCMKGKIDKCEEYFWKKEDGSFLWLKWDVRPWYILDNEIGGLLMFTENITEKKNKELASVRTSYILNKTSNIAKIGTWERNLLTGKVTCNNIALEILEIDKARQNSIKENLGFYKAGNNRKKMQAAINEAIHSGKTYDLEIEMITAKGNEKMVRVIGQVEFNNGVATTLFGLFMETKK